ncbi:MAG: hypothetical protein IPL12_14020 [Bacteroidetes bacterium]|nr:hypothetical protein [Bacteroidota bacterium]
MPQDDTYFADDYATGNVDVDDLLKLDEVSFKSNVLHIVIERIKSKNYDLEKKDSRYDKAHKKALKAETKLLKEYFAVRGIKYRAQGFDIEAMTLDANSNKGTIEYVFDFGSVKQIVVQPIEYEKDGKIVKWQLASDSVVSSSIRVNSEKKLKK